MRARIIRLMIISGVFFVRRVVVVKPMILGQDYPTLTLTTRCMASPNQDDNQATAEVPHNEEKKYYMSRSFWLVILGLNMSSFLALLEGVCRGSDDTSHFLIIHRLLYPMHFQPSLPTFIVRTTSGLGQLTISQQLPSCRLQVY